MGNSPNSILRASRDSQGGTQGDKTKKVVIEYPNGDVYEGELI